MTKGRWLTLALVLVFVLRGLTGGLIAHRPSALNAQERQLLSEPPLPYTVIVTTWNAETAKRLFQKPLPYAQSLANAVIPSGAFRASRFDPTAQANEADLIATSTGAYCNTAVLPLYTILTLGILPTVFDDEDCVGMELRHPGPAACARSIRIEFHSRNRVVIGWAAVVLGIMPGWSNGSPADDSRFRQRFRLEVIKHRSEIERLIRDPVTAVCKPELQMPAELFSSELHVDVEPRSGEFMGTLTVRNRSEVPARDTVVSVFTRVGSRPAAFEPSLGTVTLAPNETKTWRFPVRVRQMPASQQVIRVGAAVKPVDEGRTYSYVQVDFLQGSVGGSGKSAETIVTP